MGHKYLGDTLLNYIMAYWLGQHSFDVKACNKKSPGKLNTNMYRICIEIQYLKLQKKLY